MNSPSRFLLAALFGCSAGACTFPEPTIDSGIDAAPCAVSANCEGKTTSCAKQARSDRDSCQAQSCGGMACSMCTMPFDAALLACIADCEACGKLDGCENGTDHCEALANAP